MKKSHLVILALVSLMAAAVIAWNIAYPSGTWRYKITVNVETPEGLKSGSVVREVHVVSAGPLGAIPSVTASEQMRGEAVVVDLGERGKLFALIDNDDYQRVFDVFFLPGRKSRGGGTTSEGIRYYKSLKNVSAVLPLESYPRIVAFKDINDPKTVIEPYKVIFGDASRPSRERSTAQGVEDNLAEVFGTGVRLKDIIIEMTDEPVTWGIIKILPWLPNYYNRQFNGSASSAIPVDGPLADRISSGYFSTGENNE